MRRDVDMHLYMHMCTFTCTKERKVQKKKLTMPLEHIDFHVVSMTIKHVVIVTYFFKGNPLLPHMLLFPITSKGSFIYTFPQTAQHIPVFGGPVVDHWLVLVHMYTHIHHVW